MIERVLVDDTATEHEVAQVATAFADAGFAVPVEPSYSRKAADVLPWVVHVTLAVPIAAFFASFGSEAGKDAYASIRVWVKAVWTARASRSGGGAIQIVDPDRSRIILSSRITDDALEALRAIDWAQRRGDYLTWDERKARWRGRADG